jgi:hypothetical protein
LFKKRQHFVNLLEINFSQLEISIWYVIKGFWNCPKYRENLWIILDWVGAELNSLSLLYVRDIFLSGNYESFLNLYVIDIFSSGSYESFLNLYVRHILSGRYGSFLNLYVTDIFLSGSLKTFLYVDDILWMDKLVLRNPNKWY